MKKKEKEKQKKTFIIAISPFYVSLSATDLQYDALRIRGDAIIMAKYATFGM